MGMNEDISTDVLAINGCNKFLRSSIAIKPQDKLFTLSAKSQRLWTKSP